MADETSGAQTRSAVISSFHDVIEVTKDVATLLREVIVVVVILLFFFWTSLFKNLATNLGITKFDVAGVEVTLAQSGDQTKKAAEQVAQVKQQLDNVGEQLQQLTKDPKAPDIGAKVSSLTATVQTLQNQTDTADQTLRSSLLNQQQILKEVAPQAPSPDTTGWLFLGQVDEQKQKWFGEGAKNVPSTLDPAIKEGTRFTLPRTTYLYGDAATGHHLEGPILSALPAGAQVEVLAGPDYSHAIRGGYFIWAKVKRV